MRKLCKVLIPVLVLSLLCSVFAIVGSAATAPTPVKTETGSISGIGTANGVNRNTGSYTVDGEKIDYSYIQMYQPTSSALSSNYFTVSGFSGLANAAVEGEGGSVTPVSLNYRYLMYSFDITTASQYPEMVKFHAPSYSYYVNNTDTTHTTKSAFGSLFMLNSGAINGYSLNDGPMVWHNITFVVDLTNTNFAIYADGRLVNVITANFGTKIMNSFDIRVETNSVYNDAGSTLLIRTREKAYYTELEGNDLLTALANGTVDNLSNSGVALDYNKGVTPSPKVDTEYTVTWKSADGTETYKTEKVKAGNFATSPGEFDHIGVRHTGWTKTQGDTTNVTSYLINQDTTFYAIDSVLAYDGLYMQVIAANGTVTGYATEAEAVTVLNAAKTANTIYLMYKNINMGTNTFACSKVTAYYHMYGMTLSSDVGSTGKMLDPAGSSNSLFYGHTVDGKRATFTKSTDGDVMMPGSSSIFFLFDNIDFDLPGKFCDFRKGVLCARNCNFKSAAVMLFQFNSGAVNGMYFANCKIESTTESARDVGVIYVSNKITEILTLDNCEIVATVNPAIYVANGASTTSYLEIENTKFVSPSKVAISNKEPDLAIVITEGTSFFPYSQAPTVDHLLTTDLTYLDKNGNEVSDLPRVRVMDEAGTQGYSLTFDYALKLEKSSAISYYGNFEDLMLSAISAGGSDCKLDFYQDVRFSSAPTFGSGVTLTLHGVTLTSNVSDFYNKGRVNFVGVTVGDKMGTIVIEQPKLIGAAITATNFTNLKLVSPYQFGDLRGDTVFTDCVIDFTGAGYFQVLNRGRDYGPRNITFNDCEITLGSLHLIYLNGWSGSHSSNSRAYFNGACVINSTTAKEIINVYGYSVDSVEYPLVRISEQTQFNVAPGTSLVTNTRPYFVLQLPEGFKTSPEGIEVKKTTAGEYQLLDGTKAVFAPTDVDGEYELVSYDSVEYDLISDNFAYSNFTSADVFNFINSASAGAVIEVFGMSANPAGTEKLLELTATQGLTFKSNQTLRLHGVTFTFTSTSNTDAKLINNTSIQNLLIEGVDDEQGNKTVLNIDKGNFLCYGYVTLRNLKVNINVNGRFTDFRIGEFTLDNCDLYALHSGSRMFVGYTKNVSPTVTLKDTHLYSDCTSNFFEFTGRDNTNGITLNLLGNTVIEQKTSAIPIKYSGTNAEGTGSKVIPYLNIDSTVRFILPAGVRAIDAVPENLVFRVDDGFAMPDFGLINVKVDILLGDTETVAVPVLTGRDTVTYTTAPSSVVLTVKKGETVLAYSTFDEIPADIVTKFPGATLCFSDDATLYFRNNASVSFSASTVIDLGGKTVTLISEGTHVEKGIEVANANRFDAASVDLEFKNGTLVLRNGSNLLYVSGSGTRKLTDLHIEARSTAIIDNRGSKNIIVDGCIIDVYYSVANVFTNNFLEGDQTSNMEFIDTTVNSFNTTAKPFYLFANSCRAGGAGNEYDKYASVLNVTVTRCEFNLGANYFVVVGDYAGSTDATNITVGEGCKISTTLPSLAYAHSDKCDNTVITLAEGTLVDTVYAGNYSTVRLGENGNLGLADATDTGYKYLITARPGYSMSSNLTLYTDIVLNLYFPEANTVGVKINGEAVDLQAAELVELPGRDGMFYAVSLPECNANEVHSTVSVEVSYTAGDKTYFVSKDISIVDYLEIAIGTATTGESLNLIANVVKYVASVYTFAGDEVPADIAALLDNDAVKNLNVETPDREDAAAEGNINNAIRSVQFNMSTSLKIRFLLNANYTGSLQINGTEYNVEAGLVNGKDYIDVSARAFKLYSSDFVVKGSGTNGSEAVTLSGSYNLVNYIYAEKIGVVDEEALNSLLSALYNYCKAAFENRPESNS